MFKSFFLQIKLAKELYMVNSAINQLKQNIDQTKRTLAQPMVNLYDNFLVNFK